MLLLRGKLRMQTDTSGNRSYELDPDSVRGALLHTVGQQPFTPSRDFNSSDPLVIKFIDRNGNQQGFGEVCKHNNAGWTEEATWEQAFSVPAELGSFKIEWNNTRREVLRRDRGAVLYNGLVGPLPGSTLSNSVNLELTLTTADTSYETRRLQRHDIYYSINGGGNWEIMTSVEPNTPYTLSTDFLPSGTNIVFKALSTDGILLDEFHIGNLIMQDRLPEVQISSPLSGDRAPTGTVWYLSGEIHDVEDGLIAGGTWSSSLDGELGMGRQCTAELSPGAHTLSYVAQDTGAHTVSGSVDVTVGPVVDMDLQLGETSLHVSPKGQDPTYGFSGQLRVGGTNRLSLLVRNGGIPNVCTGAVYVTPPVGPEALLATGQVSMAAFETGMLNAESFCPVPGTYRVRAVILPATNGVPDPDLANNTYTWTFEEEAPWAFGGFVEAWIGVDTRIPLQAFDPDGLPISSRIVDGPHHGSVYGLDTTNPVYRAGNYVGEDTLQYVANDGTGDSPARTITIQVRGRLPERPAFADASDSLYQSHVEITWSPADSATGYAIRRGTSSFLGSATPLAATTGTNYQDTTADAGVSYYYWVTSTNIAGTSSARAAGEGSRAAYAAPTALTATDNRFDGVFLQWKRVPGVYFEYYRLHRQTSPIFDPSSTWVLSEREHWTHLDEGATPGQVHYYFIRAYRSGGKLGAVAGPVTGLRLVPELDVPEFWVSQGDYPDKIAIQWRPVEGGDSYYISYKNDYFDTTYRRLAEATGTLYEHTGQSPNVSYFYRIRADRNDGQQSPQSSDQRGYTSNVNKPTNLTATEGTHSTQIVLNWTAASGVNSYDIFRASVPWLHKASYLIWTPNVTWTDVNPTPGKRHYYWVRAEADGGVKSGFAGPALGHAGPLDAWDAWSHASLTGLTPNESDPSADPDGDGQANAFEFLYRLVPKRKDGPPAPVCETREVGGLSYFVIALPASVRTDGLTVSAQHCPDLSGNQWSTTPVVTLDAGPPPVFGVRAGDRVGQSGYLRLRVVVEGVD